MDLPQTMPEWAATISNIPIALLHLLGLAGLVAWACWRSGSAHLLLVRVWSLVHGRARSPDAQIDHWLGKRSALMQFRFLTGLRCRTRTEAARLIAWAQRHDEEMGDVARCRWFFDLSKPGVKSPVPGRWHGLAAAALTAALFTGAVWMGAMAVSSRAWVTVKNGSGTTLLLSAENIAVFRSSERFAKGDCQTLSHDDIGVRMGLPVSDVAVACAWFDDPQLTAKVAETLHTQRGGGGSLFALLLLYARFPFAWLRATVAADAMAKRLRAAGGSPSGGRRRRGQRRAARATTAHEAPTLTSAASEA